jgi:hypothetical protein
MQLANWTSTPIHFLTVDGTSVLDVAHQYPPPNNMNQGAIKTSMTFRLAKMPDVSANTKPRVPVKPTAGTVAKRRC